MLLVLKDLLRKFILQEEILRAESDLLFGNLLNLLMCLLNIAITSRAVRLLLPEVKGVVLLRVCWELGEELIWGLQIKFWRDENSLLGVNVSWEFGSWALENRIPALDEFLLLSAHKEESLLVWWELKQFGIGCDAMWDEMHVEPMRWAEQLTERSQIHFL